MSTPVPSVTVSGGAGGITAHLEDLLAMAGFLQTGANAVADVIDDLRAPALRWTLEVGAGHDLIGTFEVLGELAALTGPFGPLALGRDHLAVLAERLGAAVLAYRHVDDGVLAGLFHSLSHSLGHLMLGSLEMATGHVHAGSDEVFDAFPGLADAATLAAGGGLPLADLIDDGHPVVHDLGPDQRPAAELAPHTLAGLISALELRNTGRHGEISVSFVVGTDGRRRTIVDIPGTKSWNPAPNRDITNVGTDIRALAGRDTSYEEGVFTAMRAAGVGPHDDVMLVGHSEGGIVAVNAARDAARSGRFHVTHVVAAGSPIGGVVRSVPSTVQVLALENSADVVPHLDGASNPDRPNITTVAVDEQHDSIIGNHDLDETYEPAAVAADHSCNVSVDEFVHGARHYLDGTSTRTHSYWITRGF